MPVSIPKSIVVLLLLSASVHADISYSLTATLDANTYSLSGTAHVVIVGKSVPQDGDIAFFNVRVTDGLKLSIAGLSVNGSTPEIQTGGGMIGFIVPENHADQLTVDMAFSMQTLPDNEGISLLDDNVRNGISSSWYPRFVSSDQEPSDYDIDIHVTGPGMIATGGGAVEATGGLEDRRYRIKQTRSWSAALIYSPIFTEQRALVGNCDVGLFVREGSEIWAGRLLNYASEAYDFYVEEFESLSINRLDIVLGAEEYLPGAFTPSITMFKDETEQMLAEYGGVFTANYLRWQAAVNIAGTLVGSHIAQQPEMVFWLREGLSLHITERYARSALLGGPVFDNIRQYYLNAATSGKDTSLSQTVSEAKSAGLDVHQTLARSKGMWVVGLLADKLERQGFRRFVESLVDWSGPPLGNDDIQALAEQAGGVEMDSFFNSWVIGSAYVDYSLEEVRNDDGKTSVLVANKGSVATRADVAVIFDTGESETRSIELARGTQWLKFDGSGRALRVRIDPDLKLPDVDRSNNLRSFGGSERIESLYAIDARFNIGDILLVNQPGPAGQEREGEFELTVKNRTEQTAYLGVELVTSFPGGRNRGITRLFIELAPEETRTFRSSLSFPSRGNGLVNLVARYFPLSSPEGYERLNRASEPDLENYYIFDILE